MAYRSRMAGWVLGIDFGTTATAAATANGNVEVVTIDGAPRMPSTVVVDEQGALHAGVTAEREAAVAPERAERTPKRRLGDRIILLGEHAVTPVDAVAAVLRSVLDEATRRHDGKPPTAVRMTHPVTWSDTRLELLRDAATRAGLPNVELLPEPIAAAMHLGGAGISAGQHVAVYDLGGGTFDTVVLRSTGDGFAVVGAPGGDDRIGGEYFDERLYQHLGARIAAQSPQAWESLRTSDDRTWARANAVLRSEARAAKEALSSVAEATVYVPAPVDLELRVTRAELEELLAPDIERTVDELERTVTSAGLRLDDLAAVYLVGGSSRIPLVARLVGARSGRAPSTWGDPKAVVALGAAAMGRPAVDDRSATVLTTAPPAPPSLAAAATGGPSRPRRVWIVAAIAAVVLLLAGAVGVVLARDDDPSIVTAGEVFLEPAAEPGADPFTDSVAIDEVALEPSSGEGTGDGDSDDATTIETASGTTPGLYGGTRNAASCDPPQLVSFLRERTDLGAAWARVHGIDPATIGDYVAQLTPLVLREDTRVTNHGFRDGRATPRQAVLQAGTAVLVDNTGVPRVKCGCGNPLVEPTPVSGATRYSGDAWAGFEPAALAVYRAGPPVTEFVVTDIVSGDEFVRPLGTTGDADADGPDVEDPTTDTTIDDESDSDVPLTAGPGVVTAAMGETKTTAYGFEVTVSRPVTIGDACILTHDRTPGKTGPCSGDELVSPGRHHTALMRVCNRTPDSYPWLSIAVSMYITDRVSLAERGFSAGLRGPIEPARDPAGRIPEALTVSVGDNNIAAPGACAEGSVVFTADTDETLDDIAFAFLELSLGGGPDIVAWFVGDVPPTTVTSTPVISEPGGS